jgi:hypothetical protein
VRSAALLSERIAFNATALPKLIRARSVVIMKEIKRALNGISY